MAEERGNLTIKNALKDFLSFSFTRESLFHKHKTNFERLTFLILIYAWFGSIVI